MNGTCARCRSLGNNYFNGAVPPGISALTALTILCAPARSLGLPAARSLPGRTHVAIGGALRLWPPLEASVRLTSCRSPLSVKLFRSACRNLAYNDFVGPLPTGIKDLITLVDMYAPDSALMRTALCYRLCVAFLPTEFRKGGDTGLLVRVLRLAMAPLYASAAQWDRFRPVAGLS